ncbi:hypothetical protein JFU58_03060, partial [Pseudomonas sp. TH34]
PNPTGWVDPLGLACVPGNCPGKKERTARQRHEEKPPETGGEVRSSTYEQALNKALRWLRENNFHAEKPKLGKFGTSSGKPIGMQTMDEKTGFRVEHDKKNGAHINVWSEKKKGPHYLFEGSHKLVMKINKRFK